MSALQTFSFDGASVRTVFGQDGEPWFVGKDIATDLGYANPQKAVRDHCKGPRPAGVNESFTPPLDPQTVLVNEPDMLRLIVGSSLPSAERFERWVFEDVLPTIRKTGGYGAPTIDPMVALNDPATMRTLLLGYTEKVLALENQVVTLAPKAAALDQIAATTEALTITQAAKVLGVKRETLTTWLHANGWIYRQNGAWVAYDQHIKNGRLQFKEARYTDEKTGQECLKPYCHVLPKGLTKLAEVFGSQPKAA